MKLKAISLTTTYLISGSYLYGEKAIQTEKKPSPNILFIFTDDHALNAIGAYGNSLCQTPNIDRIANEGAILMNNTACNSICAPSRAAILTGKHSHKNGKMTNAEIFNGDQESFPKELQRVGYETALIGKWHLKSKPQGFDHWDILPGQGDYYNPDFINENGKRRVNGYNTDLITDFTLEWLKKHQENSPQKPFLMMCQYKAPHRNWSPALRHLDLYKDEEIPLPETFFEDYSRRPQYFSDNEMRVADHLMPNYDLKLSGSFKTDKLGRAFINHQRMRMTVKQRRLWDAAYREENRQFRKARLKGRALARWKYQRYIKDYLRCIAGVDENIGRLLDYLDQTGLAENTVVIYSSDQGFYLGEHGMYDKRWMYRESFSQPFVIRWPKKIRAGTRITELTQNIDFAPTFMEIAGLKPLESMQGLSLVSLLTRQESLDREGLYYHYYEKGEHHVPRHEGVFNGRYKLISFYDDNAFELYDLKEDPNELNNLYGLKNYTDLQLQMETLLEKLKRQYEVEP